ncbi:RHS repeat-associated core domain-containing protein [Priestia taiwanensis]|uniref:Uncharacterized protein n=1 Tax=Priestia taiwanensis TaxID=1347902 RepID=A0A917ENX5_9BACI|nr:RHS repeat-associated protein [Priestia taiwanensis]GGE64631.1 hypothetical protein GCM10007140_13560 [Priestia taiwanensis]
MNTPKIKRALAGEQLNQVTGHYLLGNRIHKLTLMRFSTPDSLSSFGSEGINSYVYTNADPVNYNKSTGH